MTPEELRRIDRLIAEKVFGFWREKTGDEWVWFGKHPSMPNEKAYASVCHGRLWGPSFRQDRKDCCLPYYTTDPAAAKQVREKLLQLPRIVHWRLAHSSNERFEFAAWDIKLDNEHWAYADTEELATCLCALKAYGVEL